MIYFIESPLAFVLAAERRASLLVKPSRIWCSLPVEWMFFSFPFSSPFGQENGFRAKAFSRACQAVLVQHKAALGLEQFSLTLSMKPRQQNKRWQRGFTLNPRLQNHPCGSGAEPLLHCRGSMKNSFNICLLETSNCQKEVTKDQKKCKAERAKLSMMCPCTVCVSCQLFLRLTDILAYKFN